MASGHDDVPDAGGDGPSRVSPPQRRTLRVVATVLGLTILAVTLWQVVEVILLFLAGVLFAVLLRGPAEWLERRGGPPARWGFALVCLALLVLALVAGFLMAPRVGEQVDQLAEELPRAYAELTAGLERYGWWRALQQRGEQAMEGGGGAGGDGFLARATGVLVVSLKSVTYAVVIFFVGLYLGGQPELYVGGALRLVPPSRRDEARELLAELGTTLGRWLVGRLLSMLVIDVLTAVALYALQVPLALTLALLAGLLSFIPNFGPVLSALPAILLGLSQSPMKGVWVAVAYLGIQTVESYLVTPMIERRAVYLPPAVILLAQVALGLLFGFLGLLLADPLAALGLVLVRRLYVERTLGDDPDAAPA